METEKHCCLTCGKILKGRADKKFCDDYCRNAFNNKAQSGVNSYVRSINQLLKKNRKILEELLEKKEITTHPKSKFINRGFHFNYFTHQYINKKGDVYCFCYEYGYLPLEGDRYLIVKRKSE